MSTLAVKVLEKTRERLSVFENWSSYGRGDGEKLCLFATIGRAENEVLGLDGLGFGRNTFAGAYVSDAGREVSAPDGLLALNDGFGKFEGVPARERWTMILGVVDKALDAAKASAKTGKE